VALGLVSAGWGGGASSGVPAGFRPETAAAVGTRDYWVLGGYRCGAGSCLALVRSTDAGKHFTRVAFPPFPSRGTEPSVAFANAHDGFAYVRYGADAPLYVTHDGGRTWHRAGPPGVVDGFAIGGGKVYVVTTRHLLERSPVSRDAWLVLRHVQGRVWIAARGAHVWLLGGGPRRKPDFDTLARSNDAGRTFTTGPGPCFFELGGGLVPAGRGVVWAVCATGMMAGLWRSTNGGRSFPVIRSLHDSGGVWQPPMANSAWIVAPSPREAVLYGGVRGPLFRTSDAGIHWTRLRQTARFGSVDWFGFSTNRIGAVLTTTRSSPNRAELWRTTDGGATWRLVPIR
jgi:hypothetical protein